MPRRTLPKKVEEVEKPRPQQAATYLLYDQDTDRISTDELRTLEEARAEGARAFENHDYITEVVIFKSVETLSLSKAIVRTSHV